MKKVLIITYYWPPSGGGGVQRWLKFSKYLPQFGWQPVIFTPENPDFQIKDYNLQEEVSEDLEVLKFPIWEPYGFYNKISGRNSKRKLKQGIVDGSKDKSIFSSLTQWIRGNLFVPDPKIFWVSPSVEFLRDFVKTNSIDLIITTGPPHSMHLIGLRLKKKTGIPWIADFRDPWVRWDMLRNFHLSWPVRKAHKRMESAVVQKADKVISVSDSWGREIYQDHNKEAVVLTNGFDPDDFQSKLIERNEKFIISHCGLVNDFRNPEGLWTVLTELCVESKEFTDSLEIHFSGTVEPSVINSIQSNPILGSRFQFLEYLPHSEVLKVYQKSTVLLLLLNRSDNSKGHIPGKLFEYLAANRYVLAIGDSEGDSSEIISKTNSGITCEPDDLEGIRNAIKSFFTHYKKGNFPDHISNDEFSHKNLTSRLVDIMEKI